MHEDGDSERPRSFARLLLATGCVFLLLAPAFNVPLVAALHALERLSPEAVRETHKSQLFFALLGLFLAGSAALIRRRSAGLFVRRGAVRSALVLLFTLGPLFLLERLLRPFVEQSTTIYAEDPELGWRLVPGAEDDCLGVPVRINAHGLRGPDRAYAKPEETKRVLFLGDSVLFGAYIADDGATIPATVEARLAAAASSPVECINGAVGGYSPWQELLFLEREGARYEPDLVVLCFVLNDVTERYELRRFGGRGQGFQLDHTLAPGAFRWLRGTALYHFGRELAAQLALGEDVHEGAWKREELGVYELLLDPNAERVRAAWKTALDELDGIIGWCREHSVPLLVAVSPYTVQLAFPARNAPQRILERFAAQRDLPFLDLLPPLRAVLAEHAWTDAELFVDALHPNERGCAIIAQLIADRILAAGLLTKE